MKKIITLSYDGLVANTHILFLNDKDVVCFDVGQDKNQLMDYLNNHNLNLLGVFITHGHIDHIRGLPNIDENIPIYIHKDDHHLLNDPYYNLSNLIPPKFSIDREVIEVEDDSCIVIKDTSIKCIHTPFHTLGSCCFLIDDWGLISGDTLFHLSIGRTDLKGGYKHLENNSLKKLLAIKENLLIYPGHGINTTLEIERQKNPFLKNIK